jgi:hypothetical protein
MENGNWPREGAAHPIEGEHRLGDESLDRRRHLQRLLRDEREVRGVEREGAGGVEDPLVDELQGGTTRREQARRRQRSDA